ncbi:MAG: glycosyltransferase [Methylorubrum extorquens]|jgi:GT2 family glycosyltransferase|uniref:glycosyltransferase family 2 protein n=1 Tax=Methylorubrum extorquens TaxID=408 RepID=UPI002FEE23B3
MKIVKHIRKKAEQGTFNVKMIFQRKKAATKQIAKSNLFDPSYYIWKNNVIDVPETDAIRHYITVGWKKQFDVHPLFKSEYYLSQAGDVQEPALLHYLRVGHVKEYSPHPLFNVGFYFKQRPDVKINNIEPVKHYLEYGANEGTRATEYFDEAFYDRTYPYVKASGMNTLVHYILHGEGERLNPSRSFKTWEYLAANPDVGQSNIGALEHYILHGRAEKRPLKPSKMSHALDRGEASLSVVIPTFNRGRLLRETIILCQSYSKGLDVEFVVVNDGSNDNTEQVLDELSNSYDNILTATIANTGPGHARNLGASMATKNVILFLGDDIQPMDREFFKTHARLHAQYDSKRFAVLGKCVWPDDNKIDVNQVMRHIQGRGGEQFGYADFIPHTFLDWRFFYTANVSVKRDIVANWLQDGFSSKFTLYGFEDIEFAYRLAQEPGGFKIYYDPTSIGTHIHPYTVEGFLKRQFNTGLMAEVFIGMHDVTQSLGLQTLQEQMRLPNPPDTSLTVADYLAVMEGIKAWVRLIDRNGGLGREAWHDDMLSAVFEAVYFQGFITSQDRCDANIAAGYQYVLRNFVSRLRRTIHHEVSAAEFVYAGLFDPVVGLN